MLEWVKSDEINVKKSALVLSESIFKDQCKNKSNIKVNDVKSHAKNKRQNLLLKSDNVKAVKPLLWINHNFSIFWDGFDKPKYKV